MFIYEDSIQSIIFTGRVYILVCGECMEMYELLSDAYDALRPNLDDIPF